MSSEAQRLLRDALTLSAVERAELIEGILASSSFPERRNIGELWAAEVEDRIDAYDSGELKSRPAADVFARIDSFTAFSIRSGETCSGPLR